MSKQRLVLSATALCMLMILLTAGCSRNKGSGESPVIPSDNGIDRHGMDFGITRTLFGFYSSGLEYPAADVDLAPVAGASGEVAVLPDSSSWAVAVGIQDDPEDYTTPSRVMVRFLRNDGTIQGGEFDAFAVYTWPITQHYSCRLPKVDCLYFEYDGDHFVDVAVAFRYGEDQYDWDDINNWDVRVSRGRFIYNSITHTWSLVNGWNRMSGGGMATSGSGETHPDIAYDHLTGDLYVAWTEASNIDNVITVEVFYARHDKWAYTDFIWEGPYSLEAGSGWGSFDGWYVSLDIGEVAGLGVNVERVVGFAYTALFPPSNTIWWGCRPVVGWWSIEGGPDDDDHPPLQMLVVPGYNPDDDDPNGPKYDAGLIKIDIPDDNAPEHYAAAVFVQDTCDPEAGSYEAYGINSYDLTYTWISDPGEYQDPEDIPFDQATWPSVAVHSEYGDTAYVTFFAEKTGISDWITYATYWTFGSGVAAYPTVVDGSAEGEFTLDIPDFLEHNWGTSSSLVDVGYDNYWAAWSDRAGASEPHRVLGVRGTPN